MDLLSKLARAPSYTLAVAGGFRGVVLHIVSAMAGRELSTQLGVDDEDMARTRAALNGAALLRMLDITPHAQRWAILRSLSESEDQCANLLAFNTFTGLPWI